VVDHAETALRVNASADTAWETLRDLSRIEDFSSKVKNSPLAGEKSDGLEAESKCTSYDRSTVLEEIVEYKEG